MGRKGVVLGVGNTFRGDDGVGVAVARRVGQTVGASGEVDVLVSSGEPTALIDAWSGRPFAIVVDAIAGGDGPPGAVEIVRADEDELPWAGRFSGTHDVDLTQAIALGRALDQLPAALVVVGVHGEVFAPGDRLSPAVAAVVVDVADEVGALAGELQRAHVEGA